MVRNAIDHGIELPADRRRAGKDSAGTLRVEARHEAGQVVIEIADDGKGIDSNRVSQSALAKGLITAEQLKGMSVQDQVALILLPGLSTAEKVSDVSGRRVGMDVVKTNLDRLGGQVEISSVPGQGSLFRIKLPLTLAIIPALIVSAEGERFAIPRSMLRNCCASVRKKPRRALRWWAGPKCCCCATVFFLCCAWMNFWVCHRPSATRVPDALNGSPVQLADRRSPRCTLEGEPEVDSDHLRPGPPTPRRSDGSPWAICAARWKLRSSPPADFSTGWWCRPSITPKKLW